MSNKYGLPRYESKLHPAASLTVDVGMTEDTRLDLQPPPGHP